MFHLATLLNKLRPVFTRLEESLLTQIKARLDPYAAELFQNQLNEINLIQRNAGREINFYSMKHGKPARNPRYQFPNKVSDLLFSKIRFRLPEESQDWYAEFHLVKGFLFSVVFNKDPVTIKDRSDLIDIAVDILQNPLEDVPEQREHIEKAQPRFYGWLNEWSQKYTILDILPPVKLEEREKLIKSFEVSLPEDYLEICFYTDGFTAENLKIFGPSQMYEIVMPENNYLVVGESQSSGVIALKTRTKDSQFYFLDFIGDRTIPLGSSFKQAVEKVIEQADIFNV